MIALTSFPAFDVFIGLAFLYFLLSIVCSSINEGIATTFNLRAKTLEAGIRQLLGDDEAAKKFFEHWRIEALSKPRPILGKLPRVSHYRMPSYIPARTFAVTLMDTFDPPAGGESQDAIGRVKGWVDQAPDGRLKNMIEDALIESREHVDDFRQSLERHFDETMQRVSGWYKRRVQVILFVIALALVGAINADTFVIGQRLWKDDALRTAVVAQANNTVKAGGAQCDAPSDATPAEKAGQCVDQVKELGLPLGWSKESSPKGWETDLAKALGLLLTAFALQLGAPFWFDTLSKIAQLKGTGRASSDPATTEGATPSAPTPPAKK
ncbi:MAG TPA: hypothetical protein VGF23_19280 [Gaiellaceae bacterium]